MTLRVTVEVVPYGIETKKKKVAELNISNISPVTEPLPLDTDGTPLANYSLEGFTTEMNGRVLNVKEVLKEIRRENDPLDFLYWILYGQGDKDLKNEDTPNNS